MAQALDLVDLGMPSAQALYVGFQSGSVTATGTSAAGAAPIGAANFVNLVTASSQAGVVLKGDMPYGIPVVVFVASATTGVVYPPTGGTINGGTATTGGISLVQNAAAIFMRYDNTKWFSILTA